MLLRILKVSGHLLLFCFLTVLTQVGGLVYFINFLNYKWLNKKIQHPYGNFAAKLGSFFLLYSIFSFLFVPVLARWSGRVALPLTETHHVQPLNVLSCFFNRNYVRPALRDALFSVGEKMNKKYPGTTVNYLEANFPFINKFPLLPHLSHNDGKKLDIAFCYNETTSGKESNEAPSFTGYGISEEAKSGEPDKACECAEKGYWQYSFMKVLTPQASKVNFVLNERKTRELIMLLAEEESTGKLFLEPHLKTRLHLTNSKIMFHGCQAARHDDHVHVQIK